MTQTSPMEAIRAALDREKHAVRVYTGYANSAGDAAVREMFRLLAEEEKKHAKLLSDEIEKESLREM